jgi:hypothetical protein
VSLNATPSDLIIGKRTVCRKNRWRQNDHRSRGSVDVIINQEVNINISRKLKEDGSVPLLSV